MSQPGMRQNPQLPVLNLEYPKSLGVFSEYAEAQRAVDYLSDHEFPVQECMIVGTDLKQMERITGRLTWGRVIVGGLASGAWMGAFVGLIFSLFSTGNGLSMIISTVFIGALFGAFWAAIGYAATRGRRDFTSVSQVVATKYEVLVEHRSFDRARGMLAEMSGHPVQQEQPQAPVQQRTYSESLRDRGTPQYGQYRDDAPSAPAAPQGQPQQGQPQQGRPGQQSQDFGEQPTQGVPVQQPGQAYPQEPPRYGERTDGQ